MRMEDKFPSFRNQIYSSQGGSCKSSQTHTQRSEGASARNKFRSYELFGVRQKATPSASLRQEFRGRFRREERKEEGKKDWLVTLAAMVLRYRSTSYDLFRCSRRDCHCVCITPGLSRVIGAFGPGVCTLAVCRTLSLCSSAYTRLRGLHSRLCAPTVLGVAGGVSAGALRWLLVAASPENTENIEEVRRTEEGRGWRRLGSG